MKTPDKIDHHDLETMTSCIAQLKKKGYSEDFTIDANGITPMGSKKHYKPEQVSIENFYRFEGDSDPADSSILYAIETNDGLRGLVTDSYGPQADGVVTSFIKRVEEIQKKENYTHKGDSFKPPIYD